MSDFRPGEIVRIGSSSWDWRVVEVRGGRVFLDRCFGMLRASVPPAQLTRVVVHPTLPGV